MPRVWDGEHQVVDASESHILLTTSLPRKDGLRYYPDHAHDKFYLRVNDTGPNFRIVRFDDSAEKKPGEQPPVGWPYVLPRSDGGGCPADPLLDARSASARPERKTP